MVRLYYDRYYYHGDYLYDYSDTDDPFFVVNRDGVLGEWGGGEVQLTKRLLEKHKFTLGAEYRDNIRQDQKNADRNPFFLYLNDKRNSWNWAFYLQDEFTIRDNLILNAGMRYDYYSSFGSTINPRLALIYNLKKTTIKLLYGEAFRAPGAFEQFYAGAVNKANPHLQPETITTYELVLERYFGEHIHGLASAYYYTIGDLISQQVDLTDGLLVFKNAEEIAAKGLELALEGHWAHGLEGQLSYAVQKTEDKQTGKSLTNSPQHLAKFNLIVPLIRERLFAGLEARYMSERRTLAGRTANDFFVTNVTLFSQNLLKGVEISANIYNLFDKHYGDPGAGEHRQDLIEQDGRTFWVKLKYGF